MPATHLHCLKCAKDYRLENHYLCPACGGILEVMHDYSSKGEALRSDLQSSVSPNIWGYKNLLPLQDMSCAITLYEGGTPLIRCVNLSEKTGFENLWVKDESRNPSGAFKDRPMAVGVSMARSFNQSTVTTASSGNAAAALATYAARARLRCYIFVPEHTPPEKVTQALVNGGTCIKVRGSYSNAFALALQAAEKFLWMNITTTFLNPYAIEGDKTVAYEMFRQLGGRVPDAIFVPTGAGPLLFGVYKGFSEIRELGLAGGVPRMIAVQAEGCAPIVRAFESGRGGVHGWGVPHTIASAIADPLNGYEQDGELVLKIVTESGGLAVSVNDDEILESVYELAGNEGIYAEPAGAAPLAALKKLLRTGRIDFSDTAVCIVTGHGLKDTRSVAHGPGHGPDVPVVDQDIEALKALLE
jgi:threonine synthase